ncbi:Deleted in malignant brain tumors 1 protein [Triplophysa tibetana]|uniref:Deleted in malignant brain tumors 1 protein n=1 Tax=Triplophysa tibetana TaxID=1572043 RepID=A0A5A9N6M0_9TELE|nr:Deleted in malignant brain tumors 1 protein [Triplophysa tibetana]
MTLMSCANNQTVAEPSVLLTEQHLAWGVDRSGWMMLDVQETRKSSHSAHTEVWEHITVSMVKMLVLYVQDQYSCDYSYRNNTIRSPRSNVIEIIVVNLLQPNISLQDPDGGFVLGPLGSMVTSRHSFTITCSSEPQYPGGFFYLFNGPNITRSQSAINNTAFFILPDADYSHQGNYGCVYEVNVSSRSFHSAPSDQLLIIVRGAGNTYEGETSDTKNEEDDENVQFDDKAECKNVSCDDSEEDYVNVDLDHSEQDYIDVDTDDSQQVYSNVHIIENKTVADSKCDVDLYESFE